MDFTREEYEEWKAQSITRQLFTRFEQSKIEIADWLAEGSALADNPHLTIQNVAIQVGKVQGLNYFLKEEFLDD